MSIDIDIVDIVKIVDIDVSILSTYTGIVNRFRTLDCTASSSLETNLLPCFIRLAI